MPGYMLNAKWIVSYNLPYNAKERVLLLSLFCQRKKLKRKKQKTNKKKSKEINTLAQGHSTATYKTDLES